MFFNKSKKTESNDSGLQPINNTPLMPEVKEPIIKNTNAIYRVGFTEDERIILSLGESPNITSVLFNAQGVRTLINLLEAALTACPEQENETNTNDELDDNDGC